MKSLINIKTGEVARLDDRAAAQLVNKGTHQYISKSEFKNKPSYMTSANVTKWYDVRSSNIHSIRYFKDSHVLQIKFGQPRVASMYSYKNVPEDLFLGMINSDSKGSYFWQWIRPYKDRYPYERIW